MDARTALNEYKLKGERVDEVLFHIVSEELTRLHEEIDQIHKSSIFQALAKIYDLSFQNSVLREALEEILTLRNSVYPTEYVLRVESLARRALQQK